MPLAFFTAVLPILMGYLLFIGLSGRFSFFYQTESSNKKAVKRRAQWVAAVTTLTFSGVLYFMAYTQLELSMTPPLVAATGWLVALALITGLTRTKPEKRKRRKQRHRTHHVAASDDFGSNANSQADTATPFDLHSIEDPYESLWPDVMAGYAQADHKNSERSDGRSTDSLALASAHEIIEKERQQRFIAERHLRVTRKALAKMSRESHDVRALER